MLAELLDIAFPPSCAACGTILEGELYFCRACSELLSPLPDIHCPRCAEPGAFGAAECPRCRARRPPFHRAHAPFLHEGPVARAIHLFKYEDRPELAVPLMERVIEASSTFLSAAPTLVCAIPLHWHRMRRRRYDQAQLLAACLASRTRRTLLSSALVRTRRTRRQVRLSESEREANVQGAFRASPSLRGGAVLLVDDVFTTGSTARAASAALLEAGAAEVWVLTVARAASGH